MIKWILASNNPFTTPEEPDFRKMINISNPSLKVIGADTVSDRCMDAFLRGRLILKEKLGLSNCKLYSFTSDLWTSPNNIAYMVITVHWIDENFQLCRTVLDFPEMEGNHTGANICDVFLRSLSTFGLDKKVNLILLPRF